jgi:hypothetical protein
LKEALAKAAAANERSLSSEIEHQLEEYALVRELIPTLRRPGVLFHMEFLIGAIERAEKETGKLWPENEEAVEKAMRGAAESIRSLKRSGLRVFVDLHGGNYVLRPEDDIDKAKQS